MSGVLLVVMGGGLGKVTVTPASAIGSGSNATVQTNIVTVSVGAAGTYDYLWSLVDGATPLSLGPTFSYSSPTQRWSASLMNPGEDRNAIWRCDVSAGGNPIGFVDVGVFVQRF